MTETEWEQIARAAWEASDRNGALDKFANRVLREFALAPGSESALSEDEKGVQKLLDAYLSIAGTLEPAVPAFSLLSGFVSRLTEETDTPSEKSDIVLAALLLAYSAGLNGQEDSEWEEYCASD